VRRWHEGYLCVLNNVSAACESHVSLTWRSLEYYLSSGFGTAKHVLINRYVSVILDFVSSVNPKKTVFDHIIVLYCHFLNSNKKTVC